MFDATIRNYDLYLEEFKKNKDLDLGMVFPRTETPPRTEAPPDRDWET